MICARCDQPIAPGKAVEGRVPDSGSAARPTPPLHAHLCKKPPTQTAPTAPISR
ncbi:hypothetical protein [Streptomyces sp. YKOK-I1]